MSRLKSFRPTMGDVLQMPLKSDIDRMVPVRAESVPLPIRRVQAFRATSSWSEVLCPSQSDMGCKYGCKVYARKRGCIVEFAILHATSYGHAR